MSYAKKLSMLIQWENKTKEITPHLCAAPEEIHSHVPFLAAVGRQLIDDHNNSA